MTAGAGLLTTLGPGITLEISAFCGILSGLPWRRSSVGQSSGFISRGPKVRVLPPPPKKGDSEKGEKGAETPQIGCTTADLRRFGVLDDGHNPATVEQKNNAYGAEIHDACRTRSGANPETQEGLGRVVEAWGTLRDVERQEILDVIDGAPRSEADAE